jgi:hypothetical protein
MTIEMEAGASQLQCSMRPISAHLILTSGWPPSRHPWRGVRLGTLADGPVSTGFSKVLRGRSGGARLGE